MTAACVSSREARHHGVGAIENLQHHGLADRVLHLRRPMGRGHRILQRYALRPRPRPAANGGAQGLLKLGPEFYDGISKDYQKKRDRVCDALRTAGLTPYVPEGAYYVLCDISRIPGASGKEKAMHLL